MRISRKLVATTVAALVLTTAGDQSANAGGWLRKLLCGQSCECNECSSCLNRNRQSGLLPPAPPKGLVATSIPAQIDTSRAARNIQAGQLNDDSLERRIDRLARIVEEMEARQTRMAKVTEAIEKERSSAP